MVNLSKLKGLLAEKGITVKELSSYLSISRQAMSNKINGKTDFSLDDVVKIAKYMGLSDEDVHYIFLNTTSSEHCQKEVV